MKATSHSSQSNHAPIITAIVAQWRDCLTELDNNALATSRDQFIAGYMVGAVLDAGDIEELERAEPLLITVFDAVTSLETPLVSGDERTQLWAEVRKNVAELEKRYTRTTA